jgi:hypothetical protein
MFVNRNHIKMLMFSSKPLKIIMKVIFLRIMKKFLER